MHEIYLDTVDSTNTYAKLHAQELSQYEMSCIIADEQTAGRGRFQRTWVSPKGVNLYATFFFTLCFQTPHLHALSQIMAYSLATVLKKEGLHPKIKWPNDLQLNGKKISGILTEIQRDSSLLFIFLGVGINVNLGEKELQKIDQPATSLCVETGKIWDRKALLKKIQTQFCKDIKQFQKEGFAPFHEAFEKLLAFKGETIRCFDGEKEWVGVLHSINLEGQLNLLLPDHTLHTLSAADVRADL